MGRRTVEWLRNHLIFINKHVNDDCSNLLTPYERIRSARHGFLPKSVVLNGGEINKNKYLNDRTNSRIRSTINEGYESLTRNKLIFHQLFKSEFSDYLPIVYGIMNSSRVISDAGELVSKSPSTWLQRVVSDHGKVICKPVRASGGKGVYVVESTNYEAVKANGDCININEFAENLLDHGPYLITEFISQRSYSNSIYPETVNTLRLTTYRHPSTERMFIATGFHRFGTSQSVPVDNWDAGGIVAEVNIDTGVLGEVIMSPLSRPVEWLTKHPNTQHDIAGVQIPQWDNITSKVLEMSDYLQYYDLLAWDLVLTNTGLKIIECNEWPSISVIQAFKPILSDARLQEFYREQGYACPEI